MPYASITVAERLDMTDYLAVDEQLGASRAEGLISEAAGHGESGLQVITLWDSKAHHERFVADRLVPAFQALGIQPGPMTFTGVDVDALYLRTGETTSA